MSLNKDSRGNAYQRGYDAQWKKVRAMHLAANPLCSDCAMLNITRPADMVHHDIPIKGKNDPMRLDMGNLVSLCNDCHAIRHSNTEARGCDDQGFPVHPDHPWVRLNDNKGTM